MSEEVAAGRELDALVAETVMGWMRYDYEQGDWNGPDDVTLFAVYPNGLAVYYAWSENPDAWFAPSTDIAAAWQVVDHLRALPNRGVWLEELSGRYQESYRCCFAWIRGAGDLIFAPATWDALPPHWLEWRAA